MINVTLSEKTSINDMEIGDIISCRYTVQTSGTLGTFSELGTCECHEIDKLTSSETPDGKFYFIKVEDNKLIADRNIQHSISWSELNKKDVLDGIKLNLSNIECELTIPTGGVCYNDRVIKRVFPTSPMVSEEDSSAKVTESNVYAGRRSYRVFDMANPFNSAGGHWMFSGSTGWLKVEFKKEVLFDTIFVHKDNSTSNHYPFASVKVEGSNDDVNYSLIQEERQAEVGAFAKTVCNSVDGVVSYKYVKFTFHRDILDYGKVGEISFHNSSTEMDSLSSLTNKNQGGWPECNDWDKYIWKGTLNDKVEPSDNNIWNYKNHESWCKEVGLYGIKHTDGNTPSTGSGYTIAVSRGFVDSNINDISAKRLNPLLTSTSGVRAKTGFRPMLITKGGGK